MSFSPSPRGHARANPIGAPAGALRPARQYHDEVGLQKCFSIFGPGGIAAAAPRDAPHIFSGQFRYALHLKFCPVVHAACPLGSTVATATSGLIPFFVLDADEVAL
ncbi:unnamed protein product [Prorocentrum cordatum]|uniref:Uncharacterized protein n=1 Tax=Prorocentrum cordatum TaxID=2364126 RepID=A0ABN9YHL6_9DINO|nr:unnamed protein product [Polarella glacialis]